MLAELARSAFGSVLIRWFRVGVVESHMGNIIGECNCRLLEALKWWTQGGHGWQMVAPYDWGMQLHIARGLIMVG